MHQLLVRAGADPEMPPLSVSYGGDVATSSGPRVLIRPCRAGAWGELLAAPPNTVDWIRGPQVVPAGAALPVGTHVPALLWANDAEGGGKPFAELAGRETVVFNADIVASVLFMLTRWEETVVPVRDRHDRFPGTASVAYRQGFLHRPIVDEYALILRQWLKVLLPNWTPTRHRFRVKLSHDVDSLRRFRTWREGTRTLGGDLLKRRSPKRAWKTGAEMLAEIAAPHRTGYFRDLHRAAQLSQAHGFGDDAFYFMAAQPGPFDNDYDLGSRHVNQCIAELRSQGFEIGLHASYGSLEDPERLHAEKARLDAVIGRNDYGGRCHYLRFRVPDTWRHWERAGLAYDSTMGYADHEGFRCGTCHAFRPFDLEQDRTLALWEWPLIVMDTTLFQYRQLTPQQAEARVMGLAARCRDVEGTFTLLWHNSRLEGEWAEWGNTYLRLLGRLAEVRGGDKRVRGGRPAEGGRRWGA